MATAAVIAHVLLRSTAGEQPGVDVPIGSQTLGRLAPAPETVQVVQAHFRSAGFEVLHATGITIGISGSQALFEQHFACELARGASSTWTVRPTRGRTRSKGAAIQARDDPTSIPLDHLPPAIGRLISQIALEAEASLDQPGTDP